MDHFFHRIRQHLRVLTRLPRKRKVMLVIWSGFSVLAIIAIGTTLYYATTLSSKDRIMNRNNTGVTLLDRNGQPFYQFYNARSKNYVALKNVAPVTRKAVIASEDKNFYSEGGFSVSGIFRSAFHDVKSGGIVGGGSTISQQLVKNALLTQNQTILRKYQELILSVELNQKYTKNEILEMYLNSVYFGEGAFGIQDAAKTYFGTDAAHLDVAQSAMLIGVIPAPSAYSPISGNKTWAKQRQEYVLKRMQADGEITSAQRQTALHEQLAYAPKTQQEELKAPHFALMVKDALVKKYGEEKIARSGYKVKTTLDLTIQDKAENAVKQQVASLASSNVSNGAVVVEKPNSGELLAVVGSVDWNNTQFGKVNMATATRQPGSSFKPLMYSTGIEQKDFSAATIFKDTPQDFGGYQPKDFDLGYRGDVTMRRALANSLNIPAVEAIQKAGVGNTLTMAKKLGLTTMNDTAAHYGLPLALGSGQARLTEMTNAYSTFANQGQHNDLQTIIQIKDKNNKTTYKEESKPTQAVSSGTAYIMSSVMSDSVARAEEFGSALNLSGGRVAAVKTGTTEDYRDAWTIGFTPSLAVGVWIGNNDNAQMGSVAGSIGAAPIWRQVMEETLAGRPMEQFTKPSDVTERTICRANGALAQSSGANTMTEYFLDNTLPSNSCNAVQQTPTQQTPSKQPEETKPDQNTTDQNSQNTNQNTDQNQNNPDQNGTGDGTGTGNGTGNGTGDGTGNGNGTGTGNGSGSGGTGGTGTKPKQ